VNFPVLQFLLEAKINTAVIHYKVKAKRIKTCTVIIHFCPKMYTHLFYSETDIKSFLSFIKTISYSANPFGKILPNLLRQYITNPLTFFKKLSMTEYIFTHLFI